MEIVLTRAQNHLTLFRARFHNTSTSAWMDRVGQEEEKYGIGWSPLIVFSKFQSMVKRESANDQMVSDLIRVRNMIRTTSRWSPMTEW
jgi:hypothetical protein